MRVIDPGAYPLKPFHIDISATEGNPERNLSGAFDDFERNRAAFVVVWMLAEGGWGFRPFTRRQFKEFLADKGLDARELEYLELLVGDDYIPMLDGELRVTHEFVSRCFLACPSG